MKIAFLASELGLSGGMNVIFRHAINLNRHHGHAVTVVAVTVTDTSWLNEDIGHVRVLSLTEATCESFDVVIATFWETLQWLHLIDAHRYAWFCQSLEDRFYAPGTVESYVANAFIQLPIPVITEASWIKDALTKSCPDRQVQLVLNGIDKDTFKLGDRDDNHGGPLRILIEGPMASLTKGIRFAVSGTLRATRPIEVRHLSRDSRFLPRDHRYTPVIRELSFSEMAEMYTWADVLVKTSKVEGMFGPPLEAFHCGATAIVTPVTGFDEYISSGHNARVVSWEDEKGLGKIIDALAVDRNELNRLKRNALETASHWPNWEQSSSQFNLAISQVCEAQMTRNELRAVVGALNTLGRPLRRLAGGDYGSPALISGVSLISRLRNANYSRLLRQLKQDPLGTLKMSLGAILKHISIKAYK